MIKKFSRFFLQKNSSTAVDMLTKEDLELVETSGLFDYRFYVGAYPELGHMSRSMAMAHFLLYGAREGKSPSNEFDTAFYVQENGDVATTGMNPLVHYLRHGKREGRLPTRHSPVSGFPKAIKQDALTIHNSGQFSRDFYRKKYEDVAAHIGLDPLEHFCSYGWREGRDPNPEFSTAHYLSKYPDVAKSGMNPFVHWLKYGRAEGRKIAMKTILPAYRTVGVTKPSVIFISHDASRTGAPAVLLSFMRWLRKNTTLDFAIMIGVHGPLDREFEDIAPTFYFEDNQGSELRKRVKRFCGDNVQYVYCNTIVSSVYAEHLRFLNAEFIAHIHELESLFKVFEAQFNAFSSYCNKFVAVSETVRDCIERRIPNQRADIVVIPPFIEAFEESKVTETVKARDAKRTVYACGTVETRKGFDLFCMVGRKLRERGRDDVRLCWIGSDTHSNLNAAVEIQKHGVEGIVEWLGPQPYPRQHFRGGDIFLLPSREDPFPLVCLEAADCGLPIVCFDALSGGMCKFVGDDAGKVVKYLDTDAMTDAIVSLLDNEDARTSLGLRAQSKVRELHLVDRVAPQISQLFDGALSSQASDEMEAWFEQIDRSEIISFDIFDTLVTRRVSDPHIVFDLLEYKHTHNEPAPLSMFEERMKAAGAELQSHQGRLDDVTIDQIYERMAVFRDPQSEKDLEIALCIPHATGRKLFDYARKKNKTIYIASDMYLDESTILKILNNCGYEAWDHLFLSSKLGVKKDTGRLYKEMISEAQKLHVSPSGILHIGDNWNGDVFSARRLGIRAIRFDPLYEDESAVIELKNDARQTLSQAGRIWDATCTQAFRLWIQAHPQLAGDVFARVGFQVAGPFAAMFAMHVKKVADRRSIKKIYFLARDGRIVKDAFDTLYRDSISRDEYTTHYIHLSRATVIPASLGAVLSSNDLYFLTEGLHLRQKSIGYFLEKAGVDPSDAVVLKALRDHGMSSEDIPSWEERHRVTKLLISLASTIARKGSQNRKALLNYLKGSGFLDQENTLIVDVGWLLNIQSRLVQFLSDCGNATRLTGAYIGSRERINKSLDHEALLFEMGEPGSFARLVEGNTTLFEVLFSAAEPAAAGLTLERQPKIIFKDVDTTSKEYRVAQSVQFGAREFFGYLATARKIFFPEVVSRDYIASVFSELVSSRNEEVVAAFADFEVALGGNHDLHSVQALVPGNPKFDYQLGQRPERFAPVKLIPSATPRGKVVIVTSAGLDNGSTRYRAINLAHTLQNFGIEASVIHVEEDREIFAETLDEASAVVFQRCFGEQGHATAFLKIARQRKVRCIFEIDDLVFPDFVSVIGSVKGGEWNLDEATHVSKGYEAFMRQTDGCIVSTSAISRYIENKYSIPTAVFANRIDDRYIRHAHEEKIGDIRIGYASGTRSHKKDFDLIESAIFDHVSKENNVSLHIIGATDVGPRILALPNVFTYPVLPYDEMIRQFGALDLMLVPLEETEFNDAKSNVKFVECGAVGVPVVASPAHEYLSTIVSGENGWLVRSERDWRKTLSAVIEQPELLKHAGSSAMATVRKDFSTKSQRGISDLLKLLGLPR